MLRTLYMVEINECVAGITYGKLIINFEPTRCSL